MLLAVGFWNLVGSVGFLVCGAMGYNTAERWVDNSAISTFWGECRHTLVRSGYELLNELAWGITGSCAFLIGSLLQLYEAIWREPETSA